jgi:energy-coupling factor transporter ATP-binding protein EcfA2/energy-coupling factor transporter transmembrane protein EcfT
MVAAPRSSQGALQPPELATAAVMSAVAVAIVVLGSVIRHAGPIQLLAVVPYGVVAHRHRVRAVVAAAAAGALLTALLVGVGGGVSLAGFGLLGGFVGTLKRRGIGARATLGMALVLAPLLAGAADLALLILGSYRRLVIATVRSTVQGLNKTLQHLGPLHSVGSAIHQATTTLLAHWAITVAGLLMILTPIVVIASWWLIGGVLDRLSWITAPSQLSLAGRRAHADGLPAPTPVTMVNVTVRYPGAPFDALADIDLEIPQGQFVAVVGDNGSGKSTLARVLAGASPSSGTIVRPGRPGLGEVGGTALILQRPDAQVLGVQVADDLRWGLPRDHEVDVPGLLAAVGLAGVASQDTSTLSGGQLQRLAVASALARRPRLLISDESTAMIDPDGRAELVRLLAELPRQRGVTVVHVTHDLADVAAADRIVRLGDGRIVDDRTAADPQSESPRDRQVAAPSSAREPRSAPTEDGAPLVVATGLGHAYARGTPWENVTLQDVELTIAAGEGVLVVGDNGSGKSTLAWIMAGLLRPTAGSCELDGRPTHRQIGAIGLALQHSRLQVQRPTVGADIAEAAGWTVPAGPGRPHTLEDPELAGRVAATLARVGLPPELADRSVDQLSGGQLRRVAIAGLLAREPRLLILDEPLAGLDAPSRHGLAELLTELRVSSGLTLVVVSHDTEGLDTACPRTLQLDRGRVLDDTRPSPPPRRPPHVDHPANTRTRRAGVSAVILRRLPREGLMHRMWVGTKLAVLVLLTVATLLHPSWAQLAATALVVLLAVISARVPRSAVPRFPWWFWLTLAVGLAVAAVGNGTAHYLQLVCLSTLFMVLSAVVAWTTDLGDLAPAVRMLGAPLRRVRLPVDEWAMTTALCVRSLPLIIDECRTSIAARRLRPGVRAIRPEAWAHSLIDLLTAMMAVTIRRATDMGEAITVRGGDAGRPIRVSWTDAVTVVVVAAACAAPAALGA